MAMSRPGKFRITLTTKMEQQRKAKKKYNCHSFFGCSPFIRDFTTPNFRTNHSAGTNGRNHHVFSSFSGDIWRFPERTPEISVKIIRHRSSLSESVFPTSGRRARLGREGMEGGQKENGHCALSSDKRGIKRTSLRGWGFPARSTCVDTPHRIACISRAFNAGGWALRVRKEP